MGKVINIRTQRWVEPERLSPSTRIAYDFVCGNFQSPIGVRDVVNLTSISYDTLCRKFKMETGCTVVEMVNRLRVEKAKEIIQSSTEPMKDISQKVGFTSIVQFHRTFKKLETLTPMQYRKKCFGIE